MVIINYQKKYHKQIIASVVKSLKAGKVVAYPTDTCYGLAVDAANTSAIKRLYQIKGRDFNKPVHVVVPSIVYGKKLVQWNKSATKLADKFWPGAITLVLTLKSKGAGYKKLSGKTGSLGLRMPDSSIALDLAKVLKTPITATSANLSGAKDCYSPDEIVAQFSARGGSASGGKDQKHKPDIIISVGKLPKRKPSTLVKLFDDVVQILREGPISEKQIISLLNTKVN